MLFCFQYKLPIKVVNRLYFATFAISTYGCNSFVEAKFHSRENVHHTYNLKTDFRYYFDKIIKLYADLPPTSRAINNQGYTYCRYTSVMNGDGLYQLKT